MTGALVLETWGVVSPQVLGVVITIGAASPWMTIRSGAVSPQKLELVKRLAIVSPHGSATSLV